MPETKHTQREYDALNIFASCLVQVSRCAVPNAVVTP